MEENKYILKCRRDGIKDPYQALQEFGYQKIQDFLNDHPNKSFTEILLMLFKKIDHYYTRRAFFGCLREEIKKDGKKTAAKDHYGFLNAVMFSPEDLKTMTADEIQ